MNSIEYNPCIECDFYHNESCICPFYCPNEPQSTESDYDNLLPDIEFGDAIIL